MDLSLSRCASLWREPDAIIQRMFSLQSLRNAPHITRFMLVWFALFIGVAVASPWLHPQRVQVVCTTEGRVKLVQSGADGVAVVDDAQGMQCPQCLPVIAPPLTAVQAQAHVRLSHALTPLERARLVSLTGLPWQARAPPSLS